MNLMNNDYNNMEVLPDPDSFIKVIRSSCIVI